MPVPNTDSWAGPVIDLFDLLAKRRKYESAYQVTVVREHEQCALSGHPALEEADIQFRKSVQQNVLLLCRASGSTKVQIARSKPDVQSGPPTSTTLIWLEPAGHPAIKLRRS